MVKTFNGNHETTVDPSMMQVAIDQGIRPVGYYAPITPIATDFTMMEIGYRKACKHMIERLKAVKKDNDYRFDRIHIADNEFGLGEWYLKIAAAIGIAEDLLAEADHWVQEETYEDKSQMP